MKLRIFFLSLVSFSAFASDPWQPLEQTCKDTGSYIARGYFPGLDTLDTLNDAEAMQRLKDGTGTQLYGSFILFNSPSLPLAEKLVRLNFLHLLEKFCKITPSDTSLLNVIKELRACTQTYFPAVTRTDQYSDFVDRFQGGDPKAMATLKDIHQVLKKKLAPLPIDGAFTHITGLFSVLSPTNTSPLQVMPHEVFKVSVDPTLVKLSEKLFYYQLDLIESAHKTGKVSGGDVYSDLKSFFVKEGYDEPQATKLSFYFLGVYATRGASIISTFGTLLHPYPLAALVALSMSVSYLDKIARQHGSAYAIPSPYQAKCQIGKPYHFWLAAYQAFYLQHQDVSRVESYYLPVLGGVAYDIMGDANGREIGKLFRIKTPYDPYANSTRMDQWTHTLGAHFGKHQGKISSKNADRILEGMFKRARMPSKIPTTFNETVEEYFRIVQPTPMILELSL